MQGDIPFCHFINEAGDGSFIIIGGEGGGEPQPKRPCRRQGGATRERGVAFENLFGRGTVDNEIFQRFAGDAELHALHFFGGDLERNLFGLVDENAVAAIGDVERDVLVRLFAARAAVLVPNIHDLTVLDE